jgi:hypothetical protein
MVGQAGMIMGIHRTAAEWDAHSQGQAIANIPVVEIIKIADSDPIPWTNSPTAPLSGIASFPTSRMKAANALSIEKSPSLAASDGEDEPAASAAAATAIPVPLYQFSATERHSFACCQAAWQGCCWPTKAPKFSWSAPVRRRRLTTSSCRRLNSSRPT